nr:hypothetical protein GCM10025730_08720 [Promicromonospora thailandica]
MASPLLSASTLHKTYGSGPGAFEALRGLDLDIAEGESVAITGKSGSGKSTLMHLLALLDRPTSGTITLDGTDTARLSARQLNRTRNSTFGFVFQQFFLNAQASVLDNVTLPLKIAGVPRRERTSRAWRPWPSSSSTTRRTTAPTTCPAGRSSAWSSPGH